MSDINTTPASRAEEERVREGGRLPRVRSGRTSFGSRSSPTPSRARARCSSTSTATALNHLDVDIREGISRFPIELPHMPGVEPVGRIAALGDGVDGWRVGDRVAVYLIATCGSCRYCITGRESLCTAPDWFVGMGSPGALRGAASTCKPSQLIRIPDGVSDVEAAAAQHRVRHRMAHALHARAGAARRDRARSTRSAAGSARRRCRSRSTPARS